MQIPDTTWKALERAVNYHTTRQIGYDIILILGACFSIGWVIVLFHRCRWLMQGLGF